ncbi:MAG: PD40 domain-containing protein, partial [Thermoguttaceae bacterium]|nr:PD40 domain-containing protein [Thermoguttaceae bacterium]
MKRIFAVCAILLSTVGAAFLTSAFAAEPEPAFPVERMQRDWLYQDAGTLKVDGFFTSAESCAEEKKLVDKVLEELDGSDAEEIRRRADELASAPGNDPRWKELYFDACRIRRAARLAYFDDAPREYVYAKHFVFGDCQAMFAMTDHLTDAIFREKGDDYRMGSQLRILRIGTNGDTSSELLLDCPEGIVRDPAVSWDGKTLAFSMRRNDADDDFHLYTMNLETREITQITFGLGVADMDPDWLPNGDLIFTSTRCNFSAPCWWSSVCNLYTCDAQGRFIRRLGVDHGHTVFPHVTNDGRVIYTRWEYSDRHAGYLHSLFVMNSDGTNQTEY